MNLDVGCGERGRGDINLDIRKTSACNVIASAEHLPLRGRCMNRLLCSQVLEHLDHPSMCLKEIKRVLKAGARAELDFPKPNLTNTAIRRLLVFLFGLPFSFKPSWLKMFRYHRNIKEKDPAFFHKHLITVDLVTQYLNVNEVREIGDIFFWGWKSGRKGKFFKRWLPSLNTSYLVIAEAR